MPASKIHPDCRPYLPPEWVPQSAVQLTWPHDKTDWGAGLESAEQVFIEITRAVAKTESVFIVCHNHGHQAHIKTCLHKAGVEPVRIRYGIAQSNDSWARDHGPLTVLCQDEALLLDFEFNGWGNKYPCELDNQINRTLSTQNAFGDHPMESIDLVLEGGSIEVDGSGTLLTTRRCLLAQNRNPGLAQTELETRLSDYLGINRFLWLTQGELTGDDTDGHIDTLARFCSIDTIAYVTCNDQDHPDYESLQLMEAELKTFASPRGQSYRLIPLPLPKPIYDDTGKQLPATHANFLIINGAVLVPTYNDPADLVAKQNLASAFPGRKIIAINCLPLIRQHGSLHCITMQFPKQID
jgi:agmatine deiminase